MDVDDGCSNADNGEDIENHNGNDYDDKRNNYDHSNDRVTMIFITVITFLMTAKRIFTFVISHRYHPYHRCLFNGDAPITIISAPSLMCRCNHTRHL